MADNVGQHARGGAHIVYKSSGVIGSRGLVSPSPKRIWTPNGLFNMVAKFLHLVTKCRTTNHPRICNQQQEGFHQSVANSWMGCTWELFWFYTHKMVNVTKIHWSWLGYCQNMLEHYFCLLTMCHVYHHVPFYSLAKKKL
jgi:hypothetical protein